MATSLLIAIVAFPCIEVENCTRPQIEGPDLEFSIKAVKVELAISPQSALVSCW
jgi:hypothetical protein|tara:strand:- start:328 stop:489 length:162 start_codon:yes stop_codon:yes gene_type:complete